MSERYFEDFAVGEVFKPSGRVRVEKDEIIAFAKKFDPQFFHLDEEAARKSIFGRLVASGWHTAAMTMSLVARSEYRSAGGTIGMGFEDMRWPAPVYPGDELRIETEVLEMRASKSRPDRGVDEVANAYAQPERRSGARTCRLRYGAATVESRRGVGCRHSGLNEAGWLRGETRMRIAALSGWTSEQKHVVAAGFLGWTLDAFDFFLMVFVLRDVAKEFRRDPGAFERIVAG